MLAARWSSDTPAIVASSLVESTLAAAARFAAAGTISTSVRSLTQGVLRTMLLDKLKAISLGLVIVGAASGGVAWSIRASGAANPPDPPQRGQSAPSQDTQKDDRDTRKTVRPPDDVPRTVPPGAAGVPAVVNQSSRIASPGKNTPNLIDSRESPVFRVSSLLVVQSPDRTAIQAMSLDAGDQAAAVWAKFTVPPGVSASPLIVEDTLALALKGRTIDQVAAFSRHTGQWTVQRLLKPAEGVLSPYLSPGGAIYQVGNDAYAYSARTGTWGVLHLEGPEKPRVAVYPTHIEVLQGNRLYVFSLKHGSFSSGVEVNLNPFRREPKAAAPAR
jgi:hypothetical protein